MCCPLAWPLLYLCSRQEGKLGSPASISPTSFTCSSMVTSVLLSTECNKLSLSNEPPQSNKQLALYRRMYLVYMLPLPYQESLSEIISNEAESEPIVSSNVKEKGHSVIM